MGLETKLKIDADTKDIQRAFKAVMKSQQELSFFQQKLNKKDPFSPKNLRDSQKALDSWTKVFDGVNKVVSRNNSILDMAIQRREKLMDLNTKLGRSAARDVQIERMSQVVKVRSGAKSLNQAGQKTQSMASGIAGALEDLGPETGGATFLAGMALQATDAIKDFVMDSLVMGLKNAKNMRDLSLLTPAGSLGGVDPRTGQTYGLRNLATSGDRLLKGGWQTRDLFAMGYDTTDISGRGVDLANATGVTPGLGLIADTLRLNKMGVGQDIINRVGGGLQAGQVNQISSESFDRALNKTFGSGIALNFKSTAQMREFYSSVTGLQTMGQKTANIDYSTALQTMSYINAVGKATNNPMFRGERASNFAGMLNSGIMNPGGGVAGELINMQMLGFHGNMMDLFRTRLMGINAPGVLEKIRNMSQSNQGAIAAATTFLNNPQLAPILQDFSKGKVSMSDMKALGEGRTGDIRSEALKKLVQTDEGRALATAEEIKGLLQNYMAKMVEYLFTIAGAVLSFADLNPLYTGPRGVEGPSLQGEKAKNTSQGLTVKSVGRVGKKGQTPMYVRPDATPSVSQDSSLFH